MAWTSDLSHYQNFETPFEIPDSWEWVRLEDLTSKIGSGSTPKGSNYSEQGIPFFRSQNIHNHGLVYDDIKYISQSINESMSGTIVQANDLLLNITGGSIGRCAVVPYNFEEGNVSQHVCIIRPLLVSSDYLHFYILSDLFWKSMKLTGSGREGLPKYNLEKMCLPVPPLEEQHRIVEAIKKYNTIVSAIEDSSNWILNDISNFKSKILELAMQGKLVPQDPTDEPAAEMLKRINPKAKIITDNPHSRNIPKNWVLTNLGSVCSFISGCAFKSDDFKETGIPIVRISNIQECTINMSSCVFYQGCYDEKFLINTGDLLVAMSGATTGKMGVYNGERKALLNQRVGNIKATPAIIAGYRNYYMYSMIATILQNAYGGAQPNISASELCEFNIPLPPINEQKRIVAKIEELYSVLDKIEASLQS